jgi:hypothetical protein
VTRLLSFFVALAFLACVAPDVATYGTVHVTMDTATCREPQLGYVRRDLPNMNQYGGPAWVYADSVDTADVVIDCPDLSDDPGAGRFETGRDAVDVDPAKANGEFAFTAVAFHELIHWYVAQRGHHPERVTFHVCEHSWDHPSCWTGDYGPGMMNPSVTLADSGTDPFEHVDAGGIAYNVPTRSDLTFFHWAVDP